jgi:hypothetical protein
MMPRLETGEKIDETLNIRLCLRIFRELELGLFEQQLPDL